MPSASSEVIIKCQRDEVFAFLADPENDPQWRSGVLDLKRVSGSGIGARYAQGVKGPGGRRIPADIEITELTPGESIAFRTVAGPVRPRGRYVLVAADRGTRVRFELEADVKGQAPHRSHCAEGHEERGRPTRPPQARDRTALRTHAAERRAPARPAEAVARAPNG